MISNSQAITINNQIISQRNSICRLYILLWKWFQIAYSNVMKIIITVNERGSLINCAGGATFDVMRIAQKNIIYINILMSYIITDYSYKQAQKLNVDIMPSANKNKKHMFLRMLKKITSKGAKGYNYPNLIRMC